MALKAIYFGWFNHCKFDELLYETHFLKNPKLVAITLISENKKI
jgi:hypothetical protein